MDDIHLTTNDERRLRRLGLVSHELAHGQTAIQGLRGRLTGRAAPVTNLVRSAAEPIGHANVSAAADLGMIVPGP